MSIKNGVWLYATLNPPQAEYSNKPVLAVREIGEGKRAYRKIDICIYNATWNGNWNKRGVVYWMPLPGIPGEEADGDE